MRNTSNPNSDSVLSRLPETVRITLYNANGYFRKIDSLETRYDVFSLWHNTMSKICTVDAFYVGFLGENNTIYYPFQYDDGDYMDAGDAHYSPDGLTAWLIKNRRAYTYALDNGWLLNRGQNFGDVTKVSQDAIVVPLFDHLGAERRVIGMASVQSYSPNTYKETDLLAFQWVANQISQHLARAREDIAALQELGLGDSSHQAGMIDIDPTERFTELTRRILRQAQQAHWSVRAEEANREALITQLAKLEELSEQLQTDWIDYLSTRSSPSEDTERLWTLLTKREQETVQFALQDDLTYQAIADAMGVSITTVKTHLTNAFDKLGIRQRGELRYKLGDGRVGQASAKPPTK